MTFDTFITEGIGLITDLGVMPIIFAGAVVGVGVYVFKRVRSASR